MSPKIYIPDYVFSFPIEKQNLWLKEWLIEIKAIYSVITYAELKISIYFPNNNAELLKDYSKEEIKTIDKIYLTLTKRHFLLPIRWKQLPPIFKEMGFLDTAVFTMFADDYYILYEQDKQAIQIVDPYQFVQSNLN